MSRPGIGFLPNMVRSMSAVNAPIRIGSPATMGIKAENLPKGRICGALWSGFPTEARLVTVVVGQTNWKWCAPLIGSVRKAIEVKLDAQTVYIDNEDGRALQVFLKGHAPLPGFRLVPAFAVYDDPSAKQFYQVDPTSGPS